MGKMLSIVDVLPRHERLDIGGDQEITVFAVSGGDIGRILARFPDAFSQLAAAKPTSMNPELLGALLAATQRLPDSDESYLEDEKVEKKCQSVGVTVQLKWLKAMGRCTFPEGVGPFLEDLLSVSNSAKEASEVVIRLVSKGQATTSPPKPKLSEQPETPPSGD